MSKEIDIQAIQDFRNFVTLGQSHPVPKDKIALFLSRLAQIGEVPGVEELCKAEIEGLQKSYPPSILLNVMAQYQSAIDQYFRANPMPIGVICRQRSATGIVEVHTAQIIFQGRAKRLAAFVKTSLSPPAHARPKPQPYPLWSAVTAAESAVVSEDWKILYAALIFACQWNPLHNLHQIEFHALNQYQLQLIPSEEYSPWLEPLERWSLLETTSCIQAFEKLRQQSGSMASAPFSPPSAESPQEADINRAIRYIFGDIIPSSTRQRPLSIADLRAAGQLAAYHLYAEESASLEHFMLKQTTQELTPHATHPQVYYCVDANGDELSAKGLRLPKPDPVDTTNNGTDLLTLSLDPQLFEQINDSERWGDGTPVERLARIVAQAKRFDQLRDELNRERAKVDALQTQLQMLTTGTIESI